MERWFIKNKKTDYKKIAKECNINEIISKILVNRDITENKLIESFINPELDKLYSPKKMKDVEKSTKILTDKIRDRKRIRIVGDYDVDGVMSVYILYKGIKNVGGIVDFVIPDRITDGYGINKKIVSLAKEDGIDTIITCDNGIAAIDVIEFAKEIGLDIIITDHHNPPFEIGKDGNKIEIKSKADAIIDPMQEDCEYPFKKLCGAGIAFKLIQNLYESKKIKTDKIYELLEYVAIATVCDVVDLVDENRIIVKKGLELINATKNLGLKKLIAEVGIGDKDISVYHLGFVIGPCINASGRLESASLALELLLCQDELKAEELAKVLKNLNEERKQMTEKGLDKVISIIDEKNLNKEKILLVYEPSIHESIAGIIAGRVKDKYYKPTIVLTNGEIGAKGSGRSIEDYDMFEELNKCKDLFNNFGGHKMAAGLSLDPSKIDTLRNRLNEVTQLTSEDLLPKIYIDMRLPLEYINFKLIEELEILEPFGKGNSRPKFAEKNIKIKKVSILGKNKNVLKLNLTNKDGRNIDAIYFGDIEKFKERTIKAHGEEALEGLYKGTVDNLKIDLIFNPAINEYMGRRSLQLVVQNYRWSK